MGRFQYNGGIQASPRPSTGNDLIIWRDQPGVSGHKSDLHSHFVTLRHAWRRVTKWLWRSLLWPLTPGWSLQMMRSLPVEGRGEAWIPPCLLYTSPSPRDGL